MKQQIGLISIAVALLINAMFYGCAHRYTHVRGYKHDNWTGKHTPDPGWSSRY